MTDGGRKTASQGRARLADFFVEDILDMSDQEILAELKNTEGDPGVAAEMMRVALEKSLLVVNKGRLAAAKAGLARSHAPVRRLAALSPAEARRRLQRVVAAAPLDMKLTFAARKEEELSDADVLGMLEDLAELGLQVGIESDGKE